MPTIKNKIINSFYLKRDFAVLTIFKYTLRQCKCKSISYFVDLRFNLMVAILWADTVNLPIYLIESLNDVSIVLKAFTFT